MGIQDRDYYRNEGPSVFDSLIPSGIACRWLIAINLGVFFLQMVAQSTSGAPGDPGWVYNWFVLDVDAVAHGQVWRLLTFAFLHGGFLHIFFNMLFLWWFGSDVEQLYGRKEFVAIYLVSAFLGGCAYEVWGLVHGGGQCLGASGAVTTMLILCALHYPRRIIYVFSILPMPIWLFAIFNVVSDALGLFRETGVAVVVHLTGAAFAVLYYKWQRSITQTLSGLMWWRIRRPRPRLKLFQPDPEREEPVAVSAKSSAAVAASGSSSVDEHLEAKLDAILEKIAKLGKDSLTQEEQQILQQASQMYKKRRT